MKPFQAELAYLRAMYNKLFGPMITYPLEKPIWQKRVSQAFGIRNTIYRSGIHNGVDHAVPIGTPVMAPVDGFEVYQTIKNHKTMGNAAYCRFLFEGKRYWMVFLHLREAPAKGVYNACDIFAYTGNNGMSTGPHLHTELWKVPVNRSLITTEKGVRNNLLDPIAWFGGKVG